MIQALKMSRSGRLRGARPPAMRLELLPRRRQPSAQQLRVVAHRVAHELEEAVLRDGARPSEDLGEWRGHELS